MSHHAEITFPHPGAVYDSSLAASVRRCVRIALSLFCSSQQHINKLLIHQCAERGGSAWLRLRGSASLHNLREHYKKTSAFDGTHETQADNCGLCSSSLACRTMRFIIYRAHLYRLAERESVENNGYSLNLGQDLYSHSAELPSFDSTQDGRLMSVCLQKKGFRPLPCLHNCRAQPTMQFLS